MRNSKSSMKPALSRPGAGAAPGAAAAYWMASSPSIIHGLAGWCCSRIITPAKGERAAVASLLRPFAWLWLLWLLVGVAAVVVLLPPCVAS